MRQKGYLGLLLGLLSSATFAQHCPDCHSQKSAVDQSCSNPAAMYTQSSTVTTSPLIGIRSAYDAQDLIVNLSTMNEDLRILQQRCKIKQQFGTTGHPCERRPLLEISGDVIGSVYYAEPFEGRSFHDINLQGARVDFLAEVSNYAFGYISMDFDNSSLPSFFPGSGQRIGNSEIFLQRAFVTIGDLSESPVYFSIGQMYVPFGRYSSYIVTNTLTSSLAKTNARAMLLGAYCEGAYASVYAFNGDADVGSTGINQWGANIGYEFNIDGFSGAVGTGIIGNIADSQGMQNTYSPIGFRGFAFDAQSEILDHRVPAFDIHGEFSWNCLGLNVEYITALRHFTANDLSFDDNGAHPSALHIEGDIKFDLCDHPFVTALAYGRTWESLGLNLPNDSFIVAVSSSIWKNTITSIEYRHDLNYESSDAAGGSGAVAVNAQGNGRNSLVGQIGIYF